MHTKRGRDTSPWSPSMGYRAMPTCQMSRESRRSRDGERLASVPSPPDPWLISHEIPTLAKPVNRGGASRTMFRAARPGWLVACLGWHVAFPRGMAGVFHPGFFNVATGGISDTSSRAQSCSVYPSCTEVPLYKMSTYYVSTLERHQVSMLRSWLRHVQYLGNVTTVTLVRSSEMVGHITHLPPYFGPCHR